MRLWEMSVEQGIDHLRTGDPDNWVRAHDAFLISKYHDDPFDEILAKDLAALALKRLPEQYDLNWWEKGLVGDMKEILLFSQRQTTMRTRAPALVELLKDPKLSKQRRGNVRRCLRDVIDRLNSTPALLERQGNYDTAINQGSRHYADAISVPALLRTAHIREEIISTLEQRSMNTHLLRVLPERLEDLLHGYRRDVSLFQLAIAYLGARATPAMLALLPTVEGSPHIPLFHTPGLLDAIERAPVIPGMTREDEQQLLSGYSGVEGITTPKGCYAIHRWPDLPKSARAFSRGLLKDAELNWNGFALLTDFAVQAKNLPLLKGTIRSSLKEMGIGGLLSEVSIDDLVTRVRIKKQKAREIGLFSSDDPYAILALPRVRRIYDDGMRVVEEFLPGASPPSWGEIVENESMESSANGFKWLAERFGIGMPRPHPLFPRLVAAAGKGAFHGYQDPKVKSLEGIIPDLLRMRQLVSHDQFETLLWTAANEITHMYGDDLSDIQEFLNICVQEDAIQKYCGPRREEARKRFLSVLRDSSCGPRGVARIAAQHDQSANVLEALRSQYAWRVMLERIPHPLVVLNGLTVTPHDSYRLIRSFTIQPELAMIAGDALRQLAPAPRQYHDRYWGTPYTENKESMHLTPAQIEEAYAYYARAQRKMGAAAPERKRLRKEVATVRALIKGERLSSEQRDVRLRKAHAITARQANRVLREVQSQAYRLGIEHLVGGPVGEIDDDLRHAMAVYYVCGKHDDARTHLGTLIKERVEKRSYSFKRHPANVTFLRDLRAQGIDTRPWTRGFSCRTRAEPEQHGERHLRRYEEEARTILSQLGIDAEDIEQGYALACARNTPIEVLGDLEVQVRALREVRTETGDARDITIRLETDPFKVLWMGDVVQNSCLALGRGNTWSTVANAIDANKRVLYAREGGRIIGRKLICIAEGPSIVQFETYTSTYLGLDAPFERATAALAERMHLPLTAYRKVSALVAKEWYDDGTRPFSTLQTESE